MNKISFYERLVNEMNRRALNNSKIKAGAEERGNLAYLCEVLPENKNEAYLTDCMKLSDSEFCWKLFDTLYSEQLRQNKTQDEKELDLLLFKAYRLKRALKKLHAFKCVRQDLFPGWFYHHEKLDKIRKM